jgi:dephospho-CoA kinase
MSATGKSTLVREPAALGYRAVDADTSEFSEWTDASRFADLPGTSVEPGKDWAWREDRIAELLSREDGDILFLADCAPNMGTFLPYFDYVGLLVASDELIIQRLKSRTGDAYGKQPAEVARVLYLRQSVEPLLRRSASHEIDTSAPIEDVLASLQRLAASLTKPAT